MSWQIALQRIEEAKSNNAFYLYLNDLSLTQLPNEVLLLENLIFLDISNNAFQEIPSLISKLIKLRYLNLNKNDIEVLDISVIEHLINLQKLFATNNRIKDIKGDFSKLENLIELSLAHNELENLPHFSKPMPEMFTFNLSNNQFVSFPFSDEEKNKLFGFYTNIVFDKNPKSGEETVKISEDITHKSEIVHEAKLVFVGMPGSGKTSLKKKLLNPEYQLTYEGSTEGIDVESWYFDFENEQQEKHQFRVNHWDFGGQEIYRATHQFFITKDTLYVLVIDPIKDRQTEDIDYWLKAIKSLSGKESPVIIVKNKCDERSANIDEVSILKNFPENVIKIITTSVKTNEGVAELREIIKNSLTTKLKRAKRIVPSNWVSIRNELESSGSDYITYETFKDICNEFEVKSSEEINDISEYYHNLGLFIHFSDNVYLRETLILNPRWGTAAFYNIYDSPSVQANNGKFTRLDLKTIWRRQKIKQGERENTPEFPEHLHMFLLDLILRFELCYRIPNKDEVIGEAFILPDLLPTKPLYLDFDLEAIDKDPIVFQIKYNDFFPSGIMYRLIVRLHEYIYENKQWQYGIYLFFDNSYGELTLDSITKTIYIKTFGGKKRFLFEEIYNSVRYVNTKFFNLDEKSFTEYVPCSCENITTKDRCFFDLERLIKRNKDGTSSIDCKKDERPKNTIVPSLIKVGKYEQFVRDISEVKNYYANNYQIFFDKKPSMFIDNFSSEKFINLFFEYLEYAKKETSEPFADKYLNVLEKYAFSPLSNAEFNEETTHFFGSYETYLKVTLKLTDNSKFSGVEKDIQIKDVYGKYLEIQLDHPFNQFLQYARLVRNETHKIAEKLVIDDGAKDSLLKEKVKKMEGREKLKIGISAIFNIFLLVADDYAKKFNHEENYIFKVKKKDTAIPTPIDTITVTAEPKIEKGAVVDCEIVRFHDSGKGITVQILGSTKRGSIFINDTDTFKYKGKKIEVGTKLVAKIKGITDKGISLSLE